MANPLAQIGRAIAPLFSYRSGSVAPVGGDPGALSPSNTAWLYNVPYASSKAITSSGQLSGSAHFIIALNRQILDFCKAPPLVENWERPDNLNPKWVPNYNHPANRLLRYPNPVLKTGSALYAGVLCDFKFHANSFIVKERNMMDDVIALHWAPAAQWKVVTTFEDARAGIPISYFERAIPQPNGKKTLEKWMPQDIIHLRELKNDPNDPRLGWNDSAAFFRTFNTADKIQDWTYWILRNRAQHGGIIGPMGDAEWSDEDCEKFDAQWSGSTTDENLGKVYIAQRAFNFTPATHSPQEMMIDEMEKLPESIIAAWFNYPPGVLGFLVGMENNSFASLDKSVEMAMENATIPLWKLVDEQMTPQLLNEPQFGHRRRRGVDGNGVTMYADMPLTVRIGRDISEVRILQPDLYKKSEADTNEWRWDGMEWNEYRALRGRAPVPESDPRGKMVYSEFAMLGGNPATAGSHMNAGGGTPMMPSGGGTPSDPTKRGAARQNDSQNPSQASKVADLLATNGNLNGHT